MSKKVTCLVILALLLVPAAVTPAQGLKGDYYKGMTLTGAIVLTRTENVDFDWTGGEPDPKVGADQFSVRWTGGLTAPVTGTYRFRLWIDDGGRLWINEKLIIDHWVDQAATWYQADVNLRAGEKYPIKVEYYENGGILPAVLRRLVRTERS